MANPEFTNFENEDISDHTKISINADPPNQMVWDAGMRDGEEETEPDTLFDNIKKAHLGEKL